MESKTALLARKWYVYTYYQSSLCVQCSITFTLSIPLPVNQPYAGTCHISVLLCWNQQILGLLILFVQMKEIKWAAGFPYLPTRVCSLRLWRGRHLPVRSEVLANIGSCLLWPPAAWMSLSHGSASRGPQKLNKKIKLRFFSSKEMDQFSSLACSNHCT